MSGTTLPGLIGKLSHELMLACDDELTVREANSLALSTLGPRIVGRPLLQLITSMARPKGAVFIAELEALEPEQVSTTWELLLHVPRAAPLLIGLRGGRRREGGWLIMGAVESPRLSGLYHEVLALNKELTELIRQLTRQQAELNHKLERLPITQEPANGIYN